MMDRRCHKPLPVARMFGLMVCLLLGSTLAHAQNYSAEAMWQLARLGAPDISPDGRMAVVPVTRHDLEKDAASTELWLVPTKSGRARQLTRATAVTHSPVWSPDGQQIAFIAKREDDEEAQVYVIAVAGGEARRVTTVPTGASAPRWFPDARRIAFLSRIWTDLDSWAQMGERLKQRKDSKMSARVWDKAPVSHWDHFLDDRQTHLFAIGVDGGEPQAITRPAAMALSAANASVHSYDIAPDGAQVAFSADTDRSGIDSNYDIFLLPVDNPGADTLVNITTDNPAADGTPKYSPDGRSLVYLSQRIKDFYADRSRLMLHDLRANTTRDLTESWDRSMGVPVWSPDGAELFASIDDAGTQRIYRFDTKGGAPRAVTGAQSFDALAVAGTGPVIVALRQSFTEPPALVSIIARTGAATKLSTFNDAALAKLTPGKVESVTYTGANGDEVQMWVVYPPNFTPDRKWPVYLLLHGGPHNAITDGYHWRWNAQVFANWGYVTAWHNFHGSSGFGQEWTDSITRRWSQLPYEDTLKAADWFSAQPWADAERMAAGGGSFGGYLASVLLGREHPFKTLIAHAAVFNLYTQVGSDYGASKGRYGEFWDEGRDEEVREDSPHTHAANFKTPTLVIHGQRDLRVPVNHGLELFNILQNRGVPSKLVYFPDENHWILKPQNSLFWYQTKQDWLKQYVPPGPGAPAAAPAPAATPADAAAQE